MMKNGLVKVVAAIFLSSTGVANASVITFDSLTTPGASLGVYMEDGYTVTDMTGTWNQAFVFGNPVPAIYTDNTNNNMVEVLRTGGGNFILNSVEFACGIGGQKDCDTVVTGFLGGVEQFSVSTFLNTTEVWTAIAPLAGGIVIDRLLLSLDEGDSNIDNINLSTVPEPATLALLGIGIAGLGFQRRKTKLLAKAP